ncbi:MAG: RnfABCDGE type electron transport complex subunit G [Salinivirgaceae bacterium]|nr:RnfABCDGE type electron transport complex subunit G [Salinivirgaceae bacterium]
MESTFKNMVLALLIVTLVSSAILGFVYELTKQPIVDAQLKKKLEAINKVVPPYNNNPNDEMYTIEVEGGEAVEAYPAKMDNKLVGTAIKTYTNKGFSGFIQVMVGFVPNGTVYNYQVLDHKETPGLGSKMNDWFRPQEVVAETADVKFSIFDWLFGIKPGGDGDTKSIVNKTPGNKGFLVAKDGGEIDAITAATISSRAFLDAINRGYTALQKSSQVAIKQDSTLVSTQLQGGE